jgi:hypothetical protein
MACALLRNVDSGGETSQPPLPIFPPQCEILSLRLKMRRHSLQVLHYSAIQLYSVLHQLSEIRLEYSFMAVAAFLRMAIEHLHDRFLVPNLILVQQARLCNMHRTVA